MLRANRFDKGRVDFAQLLNRFYVRGVQHETGRINGRYRTRQLRFILPGAGKSEVHKINVQTAAQNRLIVHSWAASAASLRDGGSVVHDRFVERERPWRFDFRCGIDSQSQDLYTFVKWKIYSDFALGARPVRKIKVNVLIDLARMGILIRRRRSPIRVTHIEIHPALPERMHV